MRRPRAKCEHVAIGYVVADGEEIAAERLAVVEAEVLSAAKLCAGFGHVLAETVACSDLDHASNTKRRKQLGNAVVILLGAALLR